MIVYVAIDNNNGLMFNNRRQSQDRILRSDLLTDCGDRLLWMNSYSEPLFDISSEANIVIDDVFLDKAGNDDCCFVETDGLSSYEDKISKLIVYRWNRDYPVDLYFEIDLSRWKKISSKEFAGSSHDKITKEEWVRE